MAIQPLKGGEDASINKDYMGHNYNIGWQVHRLTEHYNHESLLISRMGQRTEICPLSCQDSECGEDKERPLGGGHLKQDKGILKDTLTSSIPLRVPICLLALALLDTNI